MLSMVNVKLGRLSTPEQSSLTVIPLMSGSMNELDPTITEVPESITAFHPVVSIFVLP